MKANTIVFVVYCMTAAMAATTQSSGSSAVIQCCEWKGSCSSGTQYSDPTCYDYCQDEESSAISCSSTCCIPFSPSPSPARSPTPSSSPNPYLMTCEKKKEIDPSSLDCAEIDDKKSCCEWSGDCGSLSKCTDSYCCVVM
eukprot:CFRG2682T1